MGLKRKDNGEKGSAVIIMVATLAILGVVGYVLGSLIARHQESIPTNMDSARAFTIAQSGVEYMGKYLEGRPDYTTVSTPPEMTLGTGTFRTVFSGVTATRLDAAITGVSGTATRRIMVRYQKKGGAIMSRGTINTATNPSGHVACDSSTTCNTSTIHSCDCTRENLPVSVLPDIPLPSPAPPYIPEVTAGGCDVNASDPATVTIASGVYYCNTYRIRNNKTINLTGGPVTIFCDNFNLETLANFNMGGAAGDLVIIASTSVTIGNNVNFNGSIYAPAASIDMGNSATITGIMAGNVVSLNNNYTINYDPTAGENSPYAAYMAALAEQIYWREI